MKRWRALIVDDEAPARRELRLLLAAHTDVEIVGEAARAAEAVKLAETLRPDLVFLDIELPDDTGLAIAEQLPESAALVFVTAYDHHPLQAFEVGGFDYLLKPVRPERLQRMLARWRARQGESTSSAAAGGMLTIGTKGRMLSIGRDEIVAVVATGHFTEVFLRDARKISEWRALREWEALLGAEFCRVHRRAVLAARHVREVRLLADGGALATATGWAAPFRVSRRCVAALRAAVAEAVSGK